MSHFGECIEVVEECSVICEFKSGKEECGKIEKYVDRSILGL